jgi:hypothetical protein
MKKKLAKHDSALAALKRRYKDITDAKAEIDRLVPIAFPEGTWVTYRHGDNYRRAVVVGHAYGRVKVRGVTNKEYWQDAQALVRDRP